TTGTKNHVKAASGPRAPPTSPPVSVPRTAFPSIEMSLSSFGYNSTESSDGENPDFRRCVRMSFACGSEEARQYKVFCITPRGNFVFTFSFHSLRMYFSGSVWNLSLQSLLQK